MKERAILLPLDGAPKSVAALPVAKTLADLLGATLHIAHVAEQPLAFDELQQQLSLTADALAGTVLGTLMGDPAESIARLATERGCFLTVMAMYTDHKPKSGLGSVAEAVLRRAPCPIVLVPPRSKPRSVAIAASGPPAGWYPRHRQRDSARHRPCTAGRSCPAHLACIGSKDSATQGSRITHRASVLGSATARMARLERGVPGTHRLSVRVP
jgi:nucleotide-binding universal stress UspA family protein